MQVQSGMVIAGEFQVERLIGAGGMGAVYAAKHLRTGKEVALKVLHEDLCKDREIVRRFLQEAQAAGKLRHPGVVRVFDAGDDDGILWLAMELLEGESLDAKMARGRLGAGDLDAIFHQLLDVLGEIHRHGIVHRDLKPPNVFLTRSSSDEIQVRVLDFGIAKLSDSQLGTYATQVGSFLGTLGYMAPEQMKQARDVDCRADLYAVGVILYECLSGQLPHDAETFGELVAKQHTERLRELPFAVDERERAWGKVAMTCLAVEREKRPRNVDEVLRMLRIDQHSTAVAATTTRPIVLLWRTLGALGALMVIAIFGLSWGASKVWSRMTDERGPPPLPAPETIPFAAPTLHGTIAAPASAEEEHQGEDREPVPATELGRSQPLSCSPPTPLAALPEELTSGVRALCDQVTSRMKRGEHLYAADKIFLKRVCSRNHEQPSQGSQVGSGSQMVAGSGGS